MFKDIINPYNCLLKNCLFEELKEVKYLKENAQFVQKVTFEPLTDVKHNHYGSWKFYKS